jgi:hypothetical protein
MRTWLAMVQRNILFSEVQGIRTLIIGPNRIAVRDESPV